MQDVPRLNPFYSSVRYVAKDMPIQFCVITIVAFFEQRDNNKHVGYMWNVESTRIL